MSAVMESPVELEKKTGDCVDPQPLTEEEKLRRRLDDQKRDALGAVNRGFYGIYHPNYNPTDDELMEHYIKHGGAIGYAKRLVEWEKAQAELKDKV
jgi:hypothetical protein